MRVGEFGVEILIQGQPVPDFFHAQSARTFVEGTKGSPYSVKVTNFSKRKVAAKLWVDGRYKGTWNLVRPHKSKILQGFSIGNIYKEFVFGDAQVQPNGYINDSLHGKTDESIGTILVSLFPVKRREKGIRKKHIREPKPIFLSREQHTSYFGLITNTGREIQRKQPSYKYQISDSKPIASLKLNYGASDRLLELIISKDDNLEEDTQKQRQEALASFMFDGDTTFPYFTSESNLLEAFPESSQYLVSTPTYSSQSFPTSSGVSGDVLGTPQFDSFSSGDLFSPSALTSLTNSFSFSDTLFQNLDLTTPSNGTSQTCPSSMSSMPNPSTADRKSVV